MGDLAYVESLERDGTALADAAAADLNRQISGCPGWSMVDLVWHVTEVHDFWGQVVERRLESYEDATRPARPPDGEVLATYRAGLHRLLDILRSTDPATEVWTWAPQRNAAFVQRRMAHETAVHRWDAEEAAGRPTPIAPELAVDGVDEFLEFFLADARPERLARDGSVHLHSTEPEAEWTVYIAGGGLRVDREHARANAAVRAPASDLVLALWRRIPLTELEWFGDEGTLERFLDLASRD